MPPRKSKQPAISAAEMLAAVATRVKNQAVNPNILAYRPHEKQTNFHTSLAKKRLYIGGNRSGKTVGGVVECIYYLRGDHPHKSIPDTPIRGRAVCVDWTYGIGQILIPKFKQWLPPSLLKNGSWDDSYNRENKLLTLTNSSTLEFMTYEQDVDKFAGTSRHFIYFDEEPPKGIFDECGARVVDTDGDMWITMTPVLGMTWIYDQLYMPGLNDPKSEDISVTIADITDNPYLPPGAAIKYLATLDPDERRARAHGEFVQIGGLVYKSFDKSVHVLKGTIDPKNFPRGTDIYMSMDHGYNNPTCWLWHAVLPDGQIVTFDEHYANELTVAEHAEIVKKKGFVDSATILGDPAIAQRSAINGTSIQTEYSMHGVFIGLANNDVLAGVNKVVSYLKTNPKTGRPFWHITENCPMLIGELQRLRWKTYSSVKAQFDNNRREEIHKKNDHASDAARYFFTVMPDLTPDQLVDPPKMPVNTNSERYDLALARMALNGDLNTNWEIGNKSTALEWEFS